MDKCLFCGGKARENKFGYLVCKQTYGHCGILVLAPTKGKKPSAFFWETMIDRDTGELHPATGKYAFVPTVEKFYVGGFELDREKYFSRK